MPIYEYYCEKCEREFEVEQRITEDPIKVCRLCRSRKVKRLISRTSFVLKGGGWYSDLYSSASNKSDDATKSETTAKSSDDAKPSSDTSPSSEAKPSADTKPSGDSGKSAAPKPKNKSSKGGGKSGGKAAA